MTIVGRWQLRPEEMCVNGIFLDLHEQTLLGVGVQVRA